MNESMFVFPAKPGGYPAKGETVFSFLIRDEAAGRKTVWFFSCFGHDGDYTLGNAHASFCSFMSGER